MVTINCVHLGITKEVMYVLIWHFNIFFNYFPLDEAYSQNSFKNTFTEPLKIKIILNVEEEQSKDLSHRDSTRYTLCSTTYVDASVL